MPKNIFEKIKALLLAFDFCIGLLVIHWYVKDSRPKATLDKDTFTYIEVTVTSYRPIKSQTDSTPDHTSIGTPAIMGICAASRDLLESGTLNYGDLIDVPGLGIYKVMDTMNNRHTKHIDILVYNITQERLVGWRKSQRVKVLPNV